MSLNTPKSLLIQGEKLRKLMDNRAVSPVVGTILLIAITVALAAIVATLVSGLGGRGAPPSVMLTVTAKENTDNSPGNVVLTISHNGGDDLNITDLKIQAEKSDNSMITIPAANLSLSSGTLSVGDTMTATYQWGATSAANKVIQVFIIHNPSKQKLFSSAAITIQSA
jgi:flagellin-like protein